MSFGILDILSGAASLAAGATLGPLAGAGVGAALSGGRTALQGGTAEQALMSAGTSGAMSALGAGAGAGGGFLGSEIAGETGKAIGSRVAPMAMNAGIGALRGQTAEQIAMDAAKSGGQSALMYGINQFAEGGPISPALMADRAGFKEGGEAEAGIQGGGYGDGGADIGGAMAGGGFGDASTESGGYMGSTDTGGWSLGGWMDANNQGMGPTSDMGGGGMGEANGSGLIESNPEAGTIGQITVQEPVQIEPVAPMPLAPLPYSPPARKPVQSQGLQLVRPQFIPQPMAGQPFGRPAQSPFGTSSPPVMAFAAGGRVGYAAGEYVYDEPIGPQFTPDMTVPTMMVYDQPAGPPAPPEPSWWDDNKKWAAPVGIVGGLTALGTLGNMLAGSKGKPEKKSRAQLQAEYPEQQYRGRAPVGAPVGFRPGINPEWNYFPSRGYAAGGGIESLPRSERAHQGRRVMDDAERALKSDHPAPQNAIARFRANFGDDALATLMQKARRGDGMSDSLPATIDGKQEAALASGEWVIPADVVSHIGNGSNAAGSRELKMMTDRVRKTRTGTTKQPRAIKPDTYLPG